MSSGFCNYFSGLTSTLNNLGQVASQVSSQINVNSIEQILRDSFGPGQAQGSRTFIYPGRNDEQGPSASTSTFHSSGLPSSSGCRRSSSAPSSSATTPGGEPEEARHLGSGIPRDDSQHLSTTTAMTCNYCDVKFSFLSRKKQCGECKYYFCSSCCPRPADTKERRTCLRCKILTRRPPIRSELMTLRIKDLQRFLGSRHVDTKACVEKKDLVELVLRQGGVPAEQPRSRGPLERQKSFPSSYVESTHRHDWLSKFDQAAGRGQDVTSPTEDLVEDFVFVQRSSDDDDEDNNDVVSESPLESAQRENSSPDVSSSDSSRRDPPYAVGRDANEVPRAATTSRENPLQDTLPLPGASALPTSASPSAASGRKFGDKGLVSLEQISCREDLNELSIKQMKELLTLNRVNFKGVTERDEMLKLVERLWMSERTMTESKDQMADIDLCKICMDNPVDCVMLECGHMCTCLLCGKQMNECPICRQYVVRVVRTFKS